MAHERFDVAIVGASIAGCTAARLFAQAGARIALIERSPDPDAYKVVCTHSIQPSATATIERLGLAPLIEARGAVRAGARFWAPFSGWIQVPHDVPRAWGITRQSLDPMLRRLAAETPGVELMAGETVTELLGRDGLRMADRSGHGRDLRARLVVAADGRGSTIARLADGLDLSGAEQVSKLIGKIDMPNVMRPAASDGIAFIGDAALASDPLWGVGCGWAFQSAEWLVDETVSALREGGDLDAALARYRRVFARRLGFHHWLIAEYATGRKTYAAERQFFRATARDPELARALADVASRTRQPWRLADPRVTARVISASLGRAAAG